jgi:hypothetical protein
VALDSIGTNNGNILGAAYVPGKSGTALHFNGTSDYVWIPVSPLRTNLTQFTIETWVMPEVVGDRGMAIIDNQVEDPSVIEGKIFFGLFNWGNGPSWGARLEHTRYTEWGPELYDPTILPVAGLWYHVATTWDGTTHTLYVNGAAIASGQTWFHYLPGSYPLPIGIKYWDHNSYWQGLIDEVAFYGRALTPQEIKARYDEFRYSLGLLYDQNRAVKSGATIPIKLRLYDRNGANASSTNIVLHALSLTNNSSQVRTAVSSAGRANPGDDFRFDDGGYIFNLKTTGLAPGAYTLAFQVGDDSQPYTVTFQVK